MTSEQWQQVEGLLHEALARKPEERNTFLAGACAHLLKQVKPRPFPGFFSAFRLAVPGMYPDLS